MAIKEKTRVTPDGSIEGINPETGEVLWVQKKKRPPKHGALRRAGRPIPDANQTHHWVLDGKGIRRWVKKGTSADTLPRLIWPYSHTTAAHICDLVTEGKTFKDIGNTDGFPPVHVIYQWRRAYPEFKSNLDKAIADRATYYHDELIEIAKNTKRKTVNEDKLKIDTLKWATAVGDPDHFGARIKHTGDPEKPVAFLIDTGIRRASSEAEPVESGPSPEAIPAQATAVSFTPPAQAESLEEES